MHPILKSKSSPSDLESPQTLDAQNSETAQTHNLTMVDLEVLVNSPYQLTDGLHWNLLKERLRLPFKKQELHGLRVTCTYALSTHSTAQKGSLVASIGTDELQWTSVWWHATGAYQPMGSKDPKRDTRRQPASITHLPTPQPLPAAKFKGVSPSLFEMSTAWQRF